MQIVAVGVVVFLRLEIGFQRRNQHLGEVQFLLLHQAGVGAELIHLADFIPVVHGMGEKALGAGPQNDDVLAVVHGHLGDAIVTGAPQRFVQQRVGLLAAFVGRHVVGAFEVDRVYLIGLDEFQDLHHLGGLGRRLLDVLVVDHHVVVLLVLVAFDEVGARDGLVFRLAIRDLLDAGVVVFVQQVEADGLASRGAE